MMIGGTTITRPMSKEITHFSEWFEVLKVRLSVLTPAKSLVFAASCCERLLPNYKAFARQASWGNADGLTQALNLMWQLAETDCKAADSTIQEALAVCDAAAPDTEQFGLPLTSAALDAANSIAEALEFVQDGNVDHLVTVSSLSRDSIDLYLQRRDHLSYPDDKLEEKLALDPLMIAEIRKQQHDLQVLESGQRLTADFLASFRKDSLIAGRSNLGI